MAEYNDIYYQDQKVVDKPKTTFKTGKVFLFLGIGLLITGLISLFLPDFFVLLLRSGADSASLAVGYNVTLIVSSIMVFVCTIIINIKSFSKKSVLVPVAYFAYCVFMGFLLSSIFLSIFASSIESNVNFIKTISIAFLSTALCFMLCGLIASLIKNKTLSIIIPVVSALSLGVLTLVLVNMFLNSSIVYWIVDGAFLLMIILTIVIDFKNVRNISESIGFDKENNLAIYCASQLYTDFIVLFIRLLSYIAVFSNNKNN